MSVTAAGATRELTGDLYRAIHEMAALNKADFEARTDGNEPLQASMQALLENLSKKKLFETSPEAKALVSELKIIKLRARGLSCGAALVADIKKALAYFKECKGQSETDFLSPAVQSLTARTANDAVGSLWEKRLIYSIVPTLHIGKELAEVIDDRSFEIILRFSHPSVINYIRDFNFHDCKGLTTRSILALVRNFPHLSDELLSSLRKDPALEAADPTAVEDLVQFLSEKAHNEIKSRERLEALILLSLSLDLDKVAEQALKQLISVLTESPAESRAIYEPFNKFCATLTPLFQNGKHPSVNAELNQQVWWLLIKRSEKRWGPLLQEKVKQAQIAHKDLDFAEGCESVKFLVQELKLLFEHKDIPFEKLQGRDPFRGPITPEKTETLEFPVDMEEFFTLLLSRFESPWLRAALDTLRKLPWKNR